MKNVATPPTVPYPSCVTLLQLLARVSRAHELRRGHPERFPTLLSRIRRLIRKPEFRGIEQENIEQLLDYMELVYNDPEWEFLTSDHRDLELDTDITLLTYLTSERFLGFRKAGRDLQNCLAFRIIPFGIYMAEADPTEGLSIRLNG